jgi:hypothetical protein
MGGHEAHSYWEDWGLVLLLSAFFTAPAAWFFDQGLSYAVMKWVCATGYTSMLTAISLAALAMTMAGGWLGWSLLAQARTGREDGGAQIDRSRFLALVAVGVNGLIAVLIVTAGTARYILSPCE